MMTEMKWSDDWTRNYCITMLDLLRESDGIVTMPILEFHARLIAETVTNNYRREKMETDLYYVTSLFEQYRKDLGL